MKQRKSLHLLLIILKDSYTILAGDTTALVNHSFLRVMNAEKLI